MRKTKVILFSLTALLLFISLIQKQLNVIHFKSLKGVVEEVKMPELTFASYRDGSFQSQTEQHLKQQFGCREPLIRFYNQYLWDFYGKSNATLWQIAFGKEGWIYEPWFVEDYYQGRSHYMALDSAQLVQRFEDEAFRIYQLQHILEQYGTHLMVCLLPGKDLIYPEYLPDNNKYFEEKTITARDYFGPKFKEMGVNHVNVEQWFLQMKDTASFDLFPQTGTHWSNIASLYVADSVIRYMEKLGDMNIRNLRIGKPEIGMTKEPDDDLESLMNLMRPLRENYNQYANVEPDGDTTASKPKIIVIGDSFYWNIVKQLPMGDIFSAYPYWYYNSSIYYDDPHQSTKDINLIEELLTADFVILSYCSVQQYEMSNGFTKKALINFCVDSTDIHHRKESFITYLKTNEQWYEGLVERSQEKGIPLEEVLAAEAEWQMDLNWRKFYPELCDSVPKKRSKAFREILNIDNIIQMEKQKIEENWRRTPEIMEMLQNKANERNIPLDSMMILDIQWVIDREIENNELLFGNKRINLKNN